MNLEQGTIVDGRFSLEALLGEGGMGTVWSARHVVTGKRVALKILKATTPELHRRLIREARVAAAVVHPNLVEVHDVLELEGESPILVMDLLEGETLASLLARRPRLDEATSGEILLPVVSAVAAAHAAGVVHRDLKPENVFLHGGGTERRQVKVLDFGIAKLTRELGTIRHTAPALTQTGSVLGTPTYMAPEQVFGERDIDHRADVWSVGIMLYECLAGRCPTEGENVGQIFKIISQRGFPSLAQVRPDLPTELTALVDRMLSMRAHERPDLRDVAKVLAEQAGLPCPTLPSPAGAIDVDTGSRRAPSLAMDETLAAPRPSAWRRARWWMVALTAVLVTGASGFVWSGAGAEPEPREGDPTVAAPASPQPPPPVARTALTPSAAIPADPAPTASAPSARREPVRARDVAPRLSSDPPASQPSALPGGVHASSPY